MRNDRRGLEVTTGSAAALELFEQAVEELAGYRGNPLGSAQAALAADPGFVLAHAVKAGAVIMSTERSLVPVLREAVEAGSRHASRATERERLHLAAARAWLEGDFARANDLHGAIAAEHPRDLLALQLAHFGHFALGRQALLRDQVAQVLHAWDDDVPGHGYVLGMYAFGLEETGDQPRAEDVGRRAVELQPWDAWAAHAVAHVMEMNARLAEGIAWLEETGRSWAADSTVAFHNHWHHALYLVDLGRPEAALALYDRRIRPARSDVSMELVDASALLWRLHLLGVDPGERAERLADDWRPHLADRYYAFNDVHALMAFLLAGRDADARAAVASLEASAAAGGTNARMAGEVGLPVARALVAFAHGEFEACLETLAPVRHAALAFGGSNAQRDVLGLTLVEAALRARRPALARALASERVRLRPASPPAWALTSRALSLAGDAQRADQARLQAVRLRSAGEVGRV